ncbi:MAG: 5-(carboxyamino)imidazole ribonucleotide synthase [Nitriliruptoraceae bacterium]
MSGGTAGTSARVGMVGAGQLARMTQRAAIDLGVALTVLAEDADAPAAAAGAGVEAGAPDDPAALDRLAARVDVVTFDHELVDGAALARMAARGVAVRPGPAALACAQDKLLARETFARLGLPGPAHAVASDEAAVSALAAAHGWPLVAKARRGGYDGRGVAVVADEDALAAVLARGGEWIVERCVPIAVEVAVVLARRPGGETAVYPVVETLQRDGICHELVMPARVPADVAARAVEVAAALADGIDAVGICAVELFVTPDGEVLVNEIALRPHNSGHATIEGAVTSQFHNHIRAVLDWPLGDTAMRAPVAATVNVLGADDGDVAARLPAALAVPGAHVHLYGKASRPGRKLGHVTVLGDDAEAALVAARRAARALTRG